MTIESQYDNEIVGIEEEYQKGLIDEKEYIRRMKEIEEEFQWFHQNIFRNDDLPF